MLNISSWEFSLRVVPLSFGTETAYRMGGAHEQLSEWFLYNLTPPQSGGVPRSGWFLLPISLPIFMRHVDFVLVQNQGQKNAGDTHLLHVMSMNVYECSWFIMFHDAFFGPTLELLWLRNGHFPRSQASWLDLIPSTCRLASEGFAIGVFKSNPHIWVFKGPHHYQISK